MKKILLVTLFTIVAVAAYSQKNSGLGFNYQAIIRDSDGQVVQNKDIVLRFSLLPGQHATLPTWVEEHSTKTDMFGMVAIIVGKGTRTDGLVENFADVNFAGIYYWLKIDIKEGSTYNNIVLKQLTSTPYAEASFSASAMPAGTVVPFAGEAENIPEGWLLCDGRELTRSDYGSLYKAIGVSWGAGNGSSTFNIPDLRGVFLRGVSGDSGKDANTDNRTAAKPGGNSGNKVGSYQSDEIKSHAHSNRVWNGAANHLYSANSFPAGFQSKTSFRSTGADRENTNEIVPTGGSETRPKNVYVNYIIKL